MTLKGYRKGLIFTNLMKTEIYNNIDSSSI